MKLTLSIIAAGALWSAASSLLAGPAPLMVAGHPVLWTIHLDVERLRTGPGQDLFANLDPILTSFTGDHSDTPGGKLQSVALFGLQPQKGTGDPMPLLADLAFTADGGGISRRFETISKKHNAPIEEVAGAPTIHFQHQGKEVWIAKFTDSRVIVGTSRSLLQSALPATVAGGLSLGVPTGAGEIIGGQVDVQTLLTNNPPLRDSELLKQLPHLDFHLSSLDQQLDLNATANMDTEQSARRVSRMVDGMVAALALHDPTHVPWDERLNLTTDGTQLALHLHLTADEARKVFANLAREIQLHATGTNAGE